MNRSAEIITLMGCGDIAHRLARQLSTEDYQWLGIRRNPPANNTTIQYRAADVTNPASLKQALPTHSDIVVITLTPAERSDEGYRKAFVEGTRNILNLLPQQRPPRLVLFISSTSVYGQSKGEWVDEESITEPASFTGRRLLEAEQLIQASPLTSVIVRFSGIYGPGRERLIAQVRAGKRDTLEQQQFSNRIHSNDCAAVLAHLIESHKRGQPLAPCYLASDNSPALQSEVKTWIARQLQLQDSFIYSDEALGSEYSNKRCRNSRLLESGFEFQYPDYQSGYRQVLDSL